MQTSKLLPEERVVRYAQYSVLRKDDEGSTCAPDGKPYGLEHSAFVLRPIDDACLSVVWPEFYGGALDSSLRCAIDAFRATHKVGPKSGFAVASVQAVGDFLGSRDRKVRFVHDPETGNEAHALVRQWPAADEIDLLELLAKEVWCDVILTSSLGLAPDQEAFCKRSERGQAAMDAAGLP